MEWLWPFVAATFRSVRQVKSGKLSQLRRAWLGRWYGWETDRWSSSDFPIRISGSVGRAAAWGSDPLGFDTRSGSIFVFTDWELFQSVLAFSFFFLPTGSREQLPHHALYGPLWDFVPDAWACGSFRSDLYNGEIITFKETFLGVPQCVEQEYIASGHGAIMSISQSSMSNHLCHNFGKSRIYHLGMVGDF